MKNKISFSLFAAMFFIGCTTETIEPSSDNEDINIQTSSDLPPISNSISYHNQGESCLSCHGVNAYKSSAYLSDDYDDDDRDDNDDDDDDDRDDDDDDRDDDRDDDDDDRDDNDDDSTDEKFTSGATVYSVLNASSSTDIASNYKVRLLLEYTDTKVTYASGRGSGNSYTQYPVGSINSYTAQVVDSSGGVVNSSIENSHDVTRLDCNSCHTASGNSGAPGRIVNYNYSTNEVLDEVVTSTTTSTPDTPTTDMSTSNTSFASSVMPILENSCKVCHGNSGNLTISDAVSTYSNIISNNFVNVSSSTSSLLLSKAIGVSHGGGAIISTSDIEYKTLKDWIAQGALNN